MRISDWSSDVCASDLLSRSLRGPLYSQAKHPLRQTSAQPSPPVVLVAPFSKANHSPLGSAAMGSSTPSKAQRSLKWLWEAERSLSSTWRHLLRNSCGVMQCLGEFEREHV